MFGTFKEKFRSVQDGITARGLTVGEPVQSRTHSGDNLNAGAKLLEKYQNYWQEMHLIAETNANTAQKIDAEIYMMLTAIENKHKSISTLNHKLECLPRLIREVEFIVNNIGSMRSTIEEIEEAILLLEDVVDSRKSPNIKGVHIKEDSIHKTISIPKDVTPADDVSALLDTTMETVINTRPEGGSQSHSLPM